jgi:3-oxoacyl-[acyl-carrier protein] reductase
MSKLQGRAAVVTGASQGLGAAIAESYVAEGASVLLCARGGDLLAKVGDKLRAAAREGQRIETCIADVCQTDDVDRLVQTALDSFGKVDVLVNNAGVYGPMGPIEEVDWQEWVDATLINILGTVYPCRAVLPAMFRQGRGKIINLSGGGATNPLPRITAYATSKAAIVRFTESLALEVGHARIDVNAVSPGALATRLLDQAIAAGPEKVGHDFHARMTKIKQEGGTPLQRGAELCVYLASSMSDGISGRLLSAVWDPWPSLQNHAEELQNSDIYTLRRIVPEDRGRRW